MVLRNTHNKALSFLNVNLKQITELLCMYNNESGRAVNKSVMYCKTICLQSKEMSVLPIPENPNLFTFPQMKIM